MDKKREKVWQKNKKFQHKWIFDENLAYCTKTGIWCLTYINGKGMFCNLCCLTNIMYLTNASKICNCEPNIRYRAKTVKDNFKNGKYYVNNAQRDCSNITS